MVKILEIKDRRVALVSLLGVTLLWGGTFIWMQQSLDAAASIDSTLAKNHVAIFFVMMRFVIAGILLLIFIPRTWNGLKDLKYGKGVYFLE